MQRMMKVMVQFMTIDAPFTTYAPLFAFLGTANMCSITFLWYVVYF